MKIIIGVDIHGYYYASLNMAARLKFNDPEWLLVHAVDVTVPVSGLGVPAEAVYGTEYTAVLEQGGQKVLDLAKDDASTLGIMAKTALLVGGPATQLESYAQEIDADLVSVHSVRKGRLGSLFLGSVSRGLAIGCPKSILITKGTIAPTGPLHAVFATDHSAYANEALEQFIKMNPKGIERIHVLTALHLSGDPENEVSVPTQMDPPIIRKLHEDATQNVQAAVARLKDAGYNAVGEVVDMKIDDAIRKTMDQTGSELLIMGAQGHGFMKRLLLGSTSLHQVVAEPHSVLILRH